MLSLRLELHLSKSPLEAKEKSCFFHQFWNFQYVWVTLKKKHELGRRDSQCACHDGVGRMRSIQSESGSYFRAAIVVFIKLNFGLAMIPTVLPANTPCNPRRLFSFLNETSNAESPWLQVWLADSRDLFSKWTFKPWNQIVANGFSKLSCNRLANLVSLS